MQFDPMIPIWLQVMEDLEVGIITGKHPPGSKLPGGRETAVQYGINPNTVAKAYAKLEENGYVYNVPKKGVYVAEIRKDSAKEKQIESVLKPLKDAGITRRELIEAIDRLFTEEEYAEH